MKSKDFIRLLSQKIPTKKGGLVRFLFEAIETDLYKQLKS